MKPPPKNVPGFPQRNLPHAVSEEVVTRKAVRPPADEVETSAPVLPPAPAAPSPEKPPSMFTRAKAGLGSSSWTPAGVVLVITALGGPAGIAALRGASADTQREIRDSEARIMAALEAKFEERAKAEQAAHDTINARVTVADEIGAYHAGMLCQQNGGKPHPTFPCDGFPVANKPNKAAKSPPWFVTDKPYPSQGR